MKWFLSCCIFFFLLSCSDSSVIDRPKNLIPKDEMAEILAEMALNEQAFIANPKGNVESGTRFILKKHSIKAQDFSESYKYYSITKKMTGILDESMQIIKDKDPAAEAYIEKKLKTGTNLPPLER
ncbi:DUF4296 domain-containing protein [Chryseobacterium sp.]|uniref:DUF4296 domain-containing protein n=1 Tax=Chryseobacterium sp. TaxID=1871047 RepID=UPI00162330F4|nr:DUF4296 domain-containing protein [Chryseobacterium sp.]